MDSFVTFNINNHIMAVEMLSVEKVIKLLKISSIPNSPKCLEGVLDIHNELIPVIN